MLQRFIKEKSCAQVTCYDCDCVTLHDGKSETGSSIVGCFSRIIHFNLTSVLSLLTYPLSLAKNKPRPAACTLYWWRSYNDRDGKGLGLTVVIMLHVVCILCIVLWYGTTIPLDRLRILEKTGPRKANAGCYRLLSTHFSPTFLWTWQIIILLVFFFCPHTHFF